jgi:hypothetical protein
MLKDGRQSLIEEELEAPVVGLNGECVTPDVRPPVTDSLDQPNKLALIGWQLGVVRSDWPAKEHNGAITLMQHSAKTSAGRITVHDEALGEIWQLE